MQADKRREAGKTRKSNSEKVSAIDEKIVIADIKLNTADELIVNANKVLDELINSRGKINKSDLIKAKVLLHAGIEEGATTKTQIRELNQEKLSLLSKKK